MTIGIDIRFLARGVWSGVEEYALNLLPRLFSLDKTIKFKLFYNALKKRKLNYPWTILPNVSLYQFSIPNRFLQTASFLGNLPKIDKLIGGVDVFFSPHFILAPLSGSSKKIITFHDLSFEYYPEFFSFQQRIWHTLMKPKAQALAADKIIAVSRSTKEDLVDLYKINPEKIEVIYSGMGEEFKEVEEAEMERVAKKYKLFTQHRTCLPRIIAKQFVRGSGAGPEKFILYFGTIEPRKNIKGIIKAFELLKTYNLKELETHKLIIAGSPGWLCGDIYRTAKKSKNAKDIIFTGFIAKEDKPSLYKLAELFVYPSFFEGFGFPPLEAMACGTPTIVSNTTSFPEIGDGAVLMVDPYNISEIALAMREILKDKKLKNEMKQKGLALAEKFSWGKCAEQTLKTLITR